MQKLDNKQYATVLLFNHTELLWTEQLYFSGYQLLSAAFG